MDIIPGIMGENEFAYFDENTYKALRPLINDTLAHYLDDYMSDADSNPEIVEAIRTNCGHAIKSMSLPDKIKNMELDTLVKTITPESVINQALDLDSLINRLHYIELNDEYIITSYPIRRRADFDVFLTELEVVQQRMQKAGKTKTYSDMLKRIRDNAFIFYTPNETTRPTGIAFLASRRYMWQTILQGARYVKACNERNIPILERRRF